MFNLLQLIKDDDTNENIQKEYKRKPIQIYINSYGGYVNDMWSIIDIILNSKTPIHTYCTGYAQSAAFELFLSGHRRYMTKHAKLMYHQIYCTKECNYTNLKYGLE
jgi:ATP-dependent Clp protease protease subunit